MPGLNSDGSVVLVEQGKREMERVLADRLEWAWGCRVYLFEARLAALDGYVVKDDRMVAVLEFKSRETVWDPVWVSKRKVEALGQVAAGLSVYRRPCCGLFVVEGSGRMGWVNVADVVGCKVAVVGRSKERDGAPHDKEECYLVPVGMFQWLQEVGDGAEDGGAGQGAG